MDIKEFLDKYLGVIIGIIIGCLVVAFKLAYFVLCVLVIGLFGWLGYCVQNNKTTVKRTLKRGIDRVLKDEDDE